MNNIHDLFTVAGHFEKFLHECVVKLAPGSLWNINEPGVNVYFNTVGNNRSVSIYIYIHMSDGPRHSTYG